VERKRGEGKREKGGQIEIEKEKKQR